VNNSDNVYLYNSDNNHIDNFKPKAGFLAKWCEFREQLHYSTFCSESIWNEPVTFMSMTATTNESYTLKTLSIFSHILTPLYIIAYGIILGETVDVGLLSGSQVAVVLLIIIGSF
jgi:hypothetical protein